MAGVATREGHYFLFHFERRNKGGINHIMKTYNIIIVENDEDEQVFMKEGFDAVPELFRIKAQLSSGDELFDWLKENQQDLPDIILSDLNMPGKNGYDIIAAVKE